MEKGGRRGRRRRGKEIDKEGDENSNSIPAEIIDGEPKYKFALAVGGSFNPVHRSHVKVLELARDALRALFGPECVVGCYLAVAHASHVRGKCGKEGAMTKDHRLAMAAIACEEFGLNKTDKCFGSSGALLESMYRFDKNVIMVNVVGGDRAKPGKRGIGNRCNIMIGRKGSGHKKSEFIGRTAQKRQGIFSGLNSATPNVILDGNDMYIDVEDDVSSTEVRKVLKSMERSGAPREGLGALQKLVDNEVLSRGVAEYLVQHWGELYEAQNGG